MLEADASFWERVSWLVSRVRLLTGAWEGRACLDHHEEVRVLEVHMPRRLAEELIVDLLVRGVEGGLLHRRQRHDLHSAAGSAAGRCAAEDTGRGAWRRGVTASEPKNGRWSHTLVRSLPLTEPRCTNTRAVRRAAALAPSAGCAGRPGLRARPPLIKATVERQRR